MSDPDSFSYKGQGIQNTLMDLAVRFILNCPPEDLSSSSRFMFQVEEAHWFYEDFAREEDHSLPHLSIYHFLKAMYCAVPYLTAICADWEQALIDFKKYKQGIPVRGGIILNETNEKVLLVSDWNRSGWGFPRGKINKEEEDMACAIREVYEETGFNMGPYIQSPKDFLQRNVGNKNLRLYVAMNVPNSTRFETRTRKEISGIKWFPISSIASQTKEPRRGGSAAGQATKGSGKNQNQINITHATNIFFSQLKNFLRSKSKAINKSKNNARDADNLKSMLGVRHLEESAQETRQELLSLLKPDQQQQQVPISSGSNSGSIPMPIHAPPASYSSPFAVQQHYPLPIQQQQLFQFHQLQQLQQQPQQLLPQSQQSAISSQPSPERDHPVGSDHEVLQQLIEEGQPLEEAAGDISNQLDGAKQILALLKREFDQPDSQVGRTQVPESLDHLANDSPALPPNSILESLVTSRRAHPRKPRSTLPTRKPVLPQTALLQVLNSKSYSKQPKLSKQHRKLTDLLNTHGIDSDSTSIVSHEPAPKPRRLENKKSLMDLLGDTSSTSGEDDKSGYSKVQKEEEKEPTQGIDLSAGNELMKLLNTGVTTYKSEPAKFSHDGKRQPRPRKSALLGLLETPIIKNDFANDSGQIALGGNARYLSASSDQLKDISLPKESIKDIAKSGKPSRNGSSVKSSIGDRRFSERPDSNCLSPAIKPSSDTKLEKSPLTKCTEATKPKAKASLMDLLSPSNNSSTGREPHRIEQEPNEPAILDEESSSHRKPETRHLSGQTAEHSILSLLRPAEFNATTEKSISSSQKHNFSLMSLLGQTASLEPITTTNELDKKETKRMNKASLLQLLGE